ncbi:MAG: hypothetical protein A2091_12000 [Desulfuromonadales bacterium GWD2_61_12]|nr:MAG: hypothetical protein A2091_12000 [Desulfuromonadales bacterium GWD2_61_12]HBT83632.1 hypothetical protein [Desulfuromonas sp.]
MRSRRSPPLLDADGLPLGSLREINLLPMEVKEGIYRELLPEKIFDLFPIEREALLDADGERSVQFICPAGLGLVRLDVRLRRSDRDSLFFVEIADTPFRQMELSFCLVNDPSSPRFQVDVDVDGRDNSFATTRRNRGEEERAMAAGLLPHQVRRGLGLFSQFFRNLECLVARLGSGLIVAEPLSYDNAIRYERYGFDYLAGKQLMQSIDADFQPGGALAQRLDGSTPFRQPGMELSLWGRSWAIHDGILGRPWDGVRIYKVPGRHAGINTFPGVLSPAICKGSS